MDTPFELILIDDCQPYLEQFKNIFNNGTKLPLRRGMLLQPSEHITKVKVKKNRTPTNTHPRVHEMADDWFLKTFGIRARSQTALCTSSLQQSKDYGFPFLVFPSGNFEVIWSRKVDDLFFHLTESKIIHLIKGETVKNEEGKQLLDDVSYINDAELYDAVSKLLDGFDYVKGHLDQALASKNEIMLYCDYYYIASNDDPNVLEFLRDYIKGNI